MAGLSIDDLADKIVPPKVEDPETNKSVETVVPPVDTDEPESNEEGKVEEEEEEVSTLVALRAEASELGVEFADDEEFEDSFEGLKSMTRAVAERSREAGADEAIQGMLDKYPGLQEYLDYLNAGGDAAKYFEVINQTSTTEPDFEDEEASKKFLKSYMKSMGQSDEEIDEDLADWEDSGKLGKKAKAAWEKKQAVDSTAKAKMIEEQQKAALKQKEDNDKYWENTEKTIKSGKIGKAGSVTIPTADRDGFFKYLAVPNKEGQSGFSTDWNSMSEEEKLAIKYMVYKKGDIGALAARKEETKRTTSTLDKLRPGNRMGTDKGNRPAPKLGLTADNLRETLNS